MKSKQQNDGASSSSSSNDVVNNNNTTQKKKPLKTPKHRLNDGKTTLTPQEYDTLNFFYKPHTLLILAIAGVVAVYFAFTQEKSVEINAKAGFFGACAAFLLFCMLQMRDGQFVRPHPAFWRVVMGMGVIYLCAVVFLLFQTADDARLMMKHVDSRLGVQLPERSYAESCDLYTPDHPESNFANLKATVNDEFIWAHLFGWWGKTLLLRDPILCWFLSITFEILELTFAHWLPNFHECWWDHIILDIFVCNALGIFLGGLTIKYMKMKEYNWTGVEKTKKKRSMVIKALKQFTPLQYDEYNWEIFSEWKRFVSIIIVIILISVIELNAFFLKTLLWIPPPTPINIYRLLLLCLIGTPGLREYYQFITDKQTKKLGAMAWICIAIISVEVLICIKYGGAMFWAIPMPPEVKYPWIIGLTIFTVGSLYYFTIHKKKSPKKSIEKTE